MHRRAAADDVAISGTQGSIRREWDADGNELSDRIDSGRQWNGSDGEQRRGGE
jgi:hypothetical protein